MKSFFRFNIIKLKLSKMIPTCACAVNNIQNPPSLFFVGLQTIYTPAKVLAVMAEKKLATSKMSFRSESGTDRQKLCFICIDNISKGCCL